MVAMLDEVKSLLGSDHCRDLVGQNHSQLIYDFTNPSAPEFRLLCTSPDKLSAETVRKYEELNLPGFSVPTEEHLRSRYTLDRYLSQSLGVRLHTKEDGTEHLKCIDDHGFILTLDFTIKLLNIHERVVCGLPCVVEGETGVSKTALTKMYSILRNAAMGQTALAATSKDLSSMEQCLVQEGCSLGTSHDCKERLMDGLEKASEATIGGESPLSVRLHELLLEVCVSRGSIFAGMPEKFKTNPSTTNVRDFLQWFSESHMEQTFHPINVDTSLSEQDFLGAFVKIKEIAQKLLGNGSTVVVFLDGKYISSLDAQESL